ncbi:MAG TPA: gliding motility-associated C-terminal domain-containing protein [Fluviicola sp.]|nr:gliding motility-associated C-terminal domain-containing protein [Fluviicola sp.]
MKALLLLLGILVSFLGFSQPPCGANPPAGNTCATATPICELNGYCGNTSASYTANSWSQSCGFLGLGDCGLTGEFCGSIENNSFLTFVASSPNISFDVWVFNSQYGDGIQIMIFDAVNCSGTVNSYYCSQLAPSAGSQNVSASGLVPGNTYYIMIDGYAGDVCDYVFAANSGVQIPVDVSPANSNICPGGTVNLTASGGNGTYTWNASPDLNTTSGANVTVTPPSTPGTYTYTVNSATGNPLCPSSTLATATIVVDNCGCTVTAGNSGPICSGAGTVNLTASNVANATYSWTGPNGFNSNLQNPTVTPPTTPGTYVYTVTADDGGTPCTATTTVTVNALPTVSAGSYSPICNNLVSLPLVGSPLGGVFSGVGVVGALFSPLVGSQTVTYDYTDANGCTNSATAFIDVNATPNVNAGTYSPVCTDAADIPLVGSPAGGTFSGNGVSGNNFDPSAGTQTITYDYTSAAGCSGSATTVITVNPLPVVSAGTYGPYCSNGPSVGLAGTPVGGTFSGTGVVGNNFNPSAGTQTITYTYTNANGCVNSATTNIIVNNAPAVNAGVDQAVCAGAQVTLSGSGASNYSWNNGVTNNVAFTPGSTQTYTVTGTDGNGCQNTDQVTVTVNPLPTITAGADQQICVGTPVTLSGNGGVSYTWTNGVTNGTPFTPGLGSATYTVTGTDANGCTGTDQVTITVVPVPIAVISSSDPLVGNPVLTVEFDNTSLFASGFSWDFDDGNTDNTTDVNESVENSYGSVGVYDVVLVASNGICSTSDTLQVIVNPFNPPNVKVPNVFTPNNDGDNDYFLFDLENVEKIEATLINRWGNLILEMNELDDQWDGTLNGNQASEGTYFYKYTATGIDGSVVSGQGFFELIR